MTQLTKIQKEISKLDYYELVKLLHETIYPLMNKKSKKITKEIGTDW